MEFTLKGNHNSSPARHSLQRQAVLHAFKQDERAPQLLLAHVNSFASLPLYKTPPSSVKNERPFNPFNHNLTDRLECPTFSPTVFKNVISPGEVSSNEFRWTIDDVSRFQPARIEESSIHLQDLETIDHETEQSAQEAIERYFSKVEIPSPWDAPRHCSSPLAETPKIVHKPKSATSDASSCNSSKTVNRCHIRVSSSPHQTHNVAVQTCWSFPPVLPKNVEAILKPYFLSPVHEKEPEEQNLNTSTLRRKLNFAKGNHELERYLSDDSMSCGHESTSLNEINWSVDRRCQAATPLPMTMLSSPDVSPILNNTKNDRSKFITRLDFTTSNCDFEDNDGIRQSKMSISISDTNIFVDNIEGCQMIDYDQEIQRIVEIDKTSSSQDTGYQTQSSDDKTGCCATIMTSAESMDTNDNSMSGWSDPVSHACSTPTKDKTDLKDCIMYQSVAS